jgi:hypothetical protein
MGVKYANRPRAFRITDVQARLRLRKIHATILTVINVAAAQWAHMDLCVRLAEIR